MAKNLVLGVGVVGSTFATVGMRMYLMAHSGYTGPGDGDGDDDGRRQRLVAASAAVADPTLTEVLKHAVKGFA